MNASAELGRKGMFTAVDSRSGIMRSLLYPLTLSNLNVTARIVHVGNRVATILMY